MFTVVLAEPAGPGTRTALLTSPAFDVVFRDLLLPLLTGGELHVAGAALRRVPDRVVAFLADRDIEVVHAVPSLAGRWAAGAAGASAPGLRWTLFAGEPLYDGHLRRWRAVAPASAMLNLYGPSETTLAKFAYRVPEPPAPGLQPVGRPLPGTVVRLRAEHADDEAVTGVDIETPYGSLGYLPDTSTAADRARFTRTDDGRTVFATQDRGHLDADGHLVITGRLDALIKRRGVFVDTAQVEAAAVEHSRVRAACCVQAGPSDDPRVVLVVEGGAEESVPTLMRTLRRVLGAEAPDRVIAVERLPLLPSGKLDRRTVRDLAGGLVTSGR